MIGDLSRVQKIYRKRLITHRLPYLYLQIRGNIRYYLNRERDVEKIFHSIEKLDLKVRVTKPDKKMIVKEIQLYINGN